jgi:acetyl-CoA carboxylase carboxyltransferase component
VPRIASRLDAESDSYRDNRERMGELVAELNTHLEHARAGGGDTAVERHHARGKLLARERIERLIDPRSLRTASTTVRRRRPGSSPASGRLQGGRAWSWPTTPR